MPSIKNGNADEEMDEIGVVLPVVYVHATRDSFSHGVRAFSAIRLAISINNIEDLSSWSDRGASHVHVARSSLTRD